MKTQQRQQSDATARQLLKKAYVWMNFGYYERAMEACERAAQHAEDSQVAEALQGAVLTASGRPLEAMRLLMKVHRRDRDAILPALYLAEACFFAGRMRRGFKVLDGLDEQRLADSPYQEFARQLRESWEQLRQVEEFDDTSDPVVVPLEQELAEQKQ